MRPQTNQADGLKTYITTLYDATLLEAGEALPIGEVRERIRGRVAARLSRLPHDWDREAELLIRSHLTQVRDGRARSLRAAWRDVTAWARNKDNPDLNITAMVDAAYKLGDGRDMTLKFWTQLDVRNLMAVRWQETAAHHEATRLLDEAGADLLAVLGSVQAGTVGDMVALVQDGATVGGVLV